MKRLFLLILPFAFLSCDSDDGNKELKEQEKANDLFEMVLNDSFNNIIKVQKDSKTYIYLQKLIEEAIAQSENKSKFGLPLLYQEKNFPSVYNYLAEPRIDTLAVQKTMIGWLCAMQLSELCPSKRNALYKAGYEAGGYNMSSYIYGYHFKNDPNVARLVASSVYAAMHTTAKPDIATMRTEIGGCQYSKALIALYDDESRVHVTDDAFYVDLRKFMASAPGPYSPLYANRSGLNPTFPDEKDANGCLKIDMDIYNTIVAENNLPDQRTVQAIADEDNDVHHLFGSDKRGVGGLYDFNAVFGESTIGETISTEGQIAEFISIVEKIGIQARSILQHVDSSVGYYEYGRLRPGCSEQQENKRKSYSDDRLNVLHSFVIEDNDGNSVTFGEGIETPEQYEEAAKDILFASSYPSGHAAGIWSAAMSMIELYPQKADLIMKAANDFATSRVISRYHWNSDIIQGRVIGSIMNPVCHATSDYNSLLDAARTEVK